MWQQVLEMAHMQAVTGLVYAGLASLGKAYPAPYTDILFKLVGSADHTERTSRRIQAVSERILDRLTQEGWHPILMKGPDIARLYPYPFLRESGDIDLYISPQEWPGFLQAHQQIASAPDGSLQWEEEGVPIDLHQRYFDLHVKEAMLPEVPSTEALLVMLSAHIRKHCMTAGIGLKQLCDMAVAYERCDYDRELLLACYARTGMLAWNRLLAAFLAKHLHVSRLPFPRDDFPSVRPLEAIVFSGGNFGQYASGRQDKLLAGGRARKTDTVLRMLKRLPFSLRYAPKEWLYYAATLLRNQ